MVAHGLGFVADEEIQASMDSRARQQPQFNILWSTRLIALLFLYFNYGFFSFSFLIPSI